MRMLLGSLAVVSAFLFFVDSGFAQAGCAATCGRYNAECKRQLGAAATQCQGAARGVSVYASECSRQERAYSDACRTRYNQCLSLCGGR
jgi:hypothetical protein